MKKTLLALCLCLPTLGWAGDPCPIDFTFHDVGSPHWLNNAKLIDALTSKDSWVGLSFTNGKGGVQITNVSEGSPAAKAKLVKGDLILSAGGQIVKTHGLLGDLLRTAKPNTSLSLRIKRGEKVLAVTLTLKGQDPVLGRLIDHASRQACANVSRGDSPKKWAKKIRAKLFAKNRRFRCKDAHAALAEEMEGGQIVMVRGSKRILLANPGWATVCVRSNELDGKMLTEKGIAKVFEKLTGTYVQDRHDNP